jgi:uncharacterized membrane protein YhaH (DUF805 family)
MKNIISRPNIAILLACLAWVITYYTALFALGDLKRADPNSSSDVARFEEQVKMKDTVIRISLALSTILAISPNILAFRRWRTARIRLSLALLISTSYLGLDVYYIFIS